MSSFPYEEPLSVRRRLMPGGYQPVEDPNSNEMVQQAARFAVDHLSEADREYTFSEAVLTNLNSVELQVIQGEQQVVAGMNYRLILMLRRPSGDFVGSFGVIIYRHFSGTMSVTKWAKELTREKALAILENEDHFEDPYTNDEGGQ